MEATFFVLVAAALWLLGVFALYRHIIEEAACFNVHDKTLPWEACFWLTQLTLLPVCLLMSTVYQWLVVPLIASPVLGYYHYGYSIDAKDQKERQRRLESALRQLKKKFPIAFNLELPAPSDPSKFQCDQFRIFDVGPANPGLLCFAPRSDVEYLAARFGSCKSCLFGPQPNDIELFLGSLFDDTKPVFTEVLPNEIELEDRSLLGPQIEKSRISSGLYDAISQKLVQNGRMSLRWHE